MIKLRILIEGNDDQRFIDNVIRPYITKNYPSMILTIKYAEDKKINVDKTIQELDAKNHKYILLGDYDSSDKFITLKKEELISECNHLNKNVIFIVKDEIESWFLSGMNTDLEIFDEFNIPDDTEGITKEMFNEMMNNSHFNSRIDLMIEISKSYDYDLATKRNNSFKYFSSSFKYSSINLSKFSSMILFSFKCSSFRDLSLILNDELGSESALKSILINDIIDKGIANEEDE